GPVDIAGPTFHRGADRLELERRPRRLAVAREGEPAALDAGPAVLALVPVDRRRGAPRPAQDEDLHVVVLVDEVASVPPGDEVSEAIEGGGLDGPGGEEAADRGRVDRARAQGADLTDEIAHAEGRGARHRHLPPLAWRSVLHRGNRSARAVHSGMV